MEVAFCPRVCYTASRKALCRRRTYHDELDLAGRHDCLWNSGSSHCRAGVIWFVCGSVAALLATFLGAALWLQVVLFLSVSAITLAATRPLVRKMSAKAVPTNLDRAIGSAARVTEEIDNDAGTGAVYVDGKTWSARSSDGSPIPMGAKVVVDRMEGVKLFVTPVRSACEQ